MNYLNLWRTLKMKTKETYKIVEFYEVDLPMRKNKAQKSISLDLEVDYQAKVYKLKNLSEIPITEKTSEAVNKLVMTANQLGSDCLKLLDCPECGETHNRNPEQYRYPLCINCATSGL